MFLDKPIETLPSTSFLTINRFKKLGINTFFDLLNYLPLRHENYSLISSINRCQEGEQITVVGRVGDFKNEITKRRFSIQKLTIYDQTGKINAIWFNQPYLVNSFKKEQSIAISGTIKRFGYQLSLMVEEYEIINGDYERIHTGRFIPYYSEKRGLSSRVIREKIHFILKNIANNDSVLEEILPDSIVGYNQLLGEKEAYFQIHYPANKKLLLMAKKRLAFDELFFLILSHELIKKNWEKELTKNQFCVDPAIMDQVNQMIASLSFSLTNAQKKALDEIINDFKKPYPMNRFLYGDVGSGKTVVAALASYISHLNGYQALLMAPTEILAFQHYQTIQKIFDNQLNISLVTASKKPRKDELKKADIIIGTHALIQKKVNFNRVGLVVIDEQHRFGVMQRAMLKEKGENPHLLTMTATPIPRTLFLTLYGELTLSVIDEMPKGRKPIKTYVVPPEKRDDGYRWIKEMIKKEKIQVYIICPIIEESETETLQSVKAATTEYEFLAKKIFTDFKVGLIHGRMKAKEKEMVMSQFKDHQLDILVSTSVIEVGIDVPNANIILIEGAERFGLAQLHQLRGRVGRSDKQAYCFLFATKNEPAILHRLSFFSRTQNGMQLAEYDLKHRGPGEVYGVRQHGFINLKIASLTDFQLINQTKKAVSYFLSHYSLKQFPELEKRLQEQNKKELISRD